MTETEERIYRRILKKMDVDEAELEGFDENSPLFEGSGEEDAVSMHLDSIDVLTLITLLEDDWGLEDIDMDEIMRLGTLKGIAGFVEERGGVWKGRA